MKYRLIDLAGFNPAEPRALGKWTKGGSVESVSKFQKSQAAKGQHGAGTMSVSTFQRLTKEKAALEAEAKHLRAEIARSKAGVHHGAAGKKAGPKGTKATAKKAAAATAAAGAGGKSTPTTLLGQVKALRVTVAKLRVEWAKIQQKRKK